MLVAAGIGLLATGVAQKASGSTKSINATLEDIGLAIVDVCWALLVLWTVCSFRARRVENEKNSTFVDGKKVCTPSLKSSAYADNRSAALWCMPEPSIHSTCNTICQHGDHLDQQHHCDLARPEDMSERSAGDSGDRCIDHCRVDDTRHRQTYVRSPEKA
jgi:hypothetical protein